MRLLSCLTTCIAAVTAVTIGKRAPTPGTLSHVTSFGNAPTNAGFYIYVPKNIASSPGIVTAIHFCTGSAEGYYNYSPYKDLSETYGFIVIYPNSPHQGSCWDVSSKETLSHGGGGDSNTIANMVKWTINKYKVDTNKVFVTGTSSGAMMTNVLAATYPNLFRAAIAYSGVPAGCFSSSTSSIDAWNSSCADGHVISTPARWSQIALAMYPGYKGARPRMQIYHGEIDKTLSVQNYQESMKQWAGVLGYDYTKLEKSTTDDPERGWTRTHFGGNLEGIWAKGVGHSVICRGDDDMRWFGFK
ncbi:carbohydrate esterase family 1 protein [Lophiostoma macrostomum CBS 122681]|uniref:Carboxylic ester hydrolase n=1 Tax=Lophiostoma macrostomum CBS 122681 TaxID=1314788 RepID=A0A6A6TED7_9PLEO|nr:carbohydrate esterase family 1 protein [Lophiostoma macrostomum CBS 122681]